MFSDGMRRNIAIMSIVAAVLAGCSPAGPSGNSSVPQPTKPVEIDQYLGHWFELARYENRFERGCEAVTADYSLRDDGMVRVLNTCRGGGINGRRKESEGRAKTVPDSGNAELKVSFFGPFYGDYWILDRAADYSWSIVGEPSGRYLWILTRTPKPTKQIRNMLVEKAKALGYDVEMLRWTQH
jgi:apolipoprotein D and lipocalin family protein